MRLHVLPASLVVEPSHNVSGRSLWIDREKNTIESSDRTVTDTSKAQSHYIDGVAGIIKSEISIICVCAQRQMLILVLPQVAQRMVLVGHYQEPSGGQSPGLHDSSGRGSQGVPVFCQEGRQRHCLRCAVLNPYFSVSSGDVLIWYFQLN
jgi:hypothetical protein